MKFKSLALLALILALALTAYASQSMGALLSMGESGAAVAPTTIPSEPVDLVVFAAASLTEPFGEIAELFEAAHPGVTMVNNFAGSQQLAQQINAGAPADVFASANNNQMNMIIETGGVVSGTQQTFANNRLVVIYPQDNPAGLGELQDLANPGLKLVFAAAEVPVGQYTLGFLEKASADPAYGSTYKDGVLANVVSFENNVKAVLTKVALGEADAGIVYSSDVPGEDGARVGQLDIPDALNVIATYPIAPVKESKNLKLAQAFIELVLSQTGQDILAKYNFIPLTATAP